MKNKTRLNKFFSVVMWLVTVLLVILVAMLCIMKATGKTPKLFGYSILQVVSPSMETEIPSGSFILVKEAPPQEVKIDDVITFYSSDPAIFNRLNTHRVLEITDDNGTLTFITKGDNNPVKDLYPVHSDKLFALYVKRLPLISSIGGVFSNPLVFLAVILLPATALLVLEIRNVKRKSDEIRREELIANEVEKLKAQQNEKKE